MNLRYFLIAVVLLAGIAVVSTRVLLASNGLWNQYDYNPMLSVDSFREYFFSLYKWNQVMPLDQQKRIVFEWVYLFVTEQQEQKIHFTALAFITLFSSYLVTLKLLSREKYTLSDLRLHAISFVAAFAYFANPMAISQFQNGYFLHSYAIFPLVFYSAYMTLASDKRRYPVMLGFAAAFSFLVMVHNALFLGFALLAAFIVKFAAERDPGKIVQAFRRCLLAGGVFLVLTAFVLLPTLYITLVEKLPQPNYITTEDYVARLAQNSEVFRILLTDSNLHPWNYLSYTYPFGDAFYVVSGLVAVFAIASAILKPNRLALTAALCIVVFTLLGKSVNAPFGEFYNDVIFNLPYFGWLFRGGQKFTYMMPLFFSLATAHALALLKDRRALALGMAAIVAVQGVFAWPAWTGNFANTVIKGPPDEGFVRMNQVLANDTGNPKTVWNAGYIESAETRALRTSNADVITMRHLFDNGRSVAALAALDEAIGTEYLLIGPRGGQHYFYSDYAFYALGAARASFEQLYKGRRYNLFRTANDTKIVYIPQSVYMDYTGFGSLFPLIQSGTDFSRTAVVFTGKDPSAYKAGPLSDTAILGPDEGLDLDINDSGIVALGASAIDQDFREGWVRSANTDFEGWQWLKVVEDKGLAADQWLYRWTTVFTQAEHGKEVIAQAPAEDIALQNDSVRGPAVAYGKTEKADGDWLAMNLTSYSKQVDITYTVDFLDSKGQFISSAQNAKSVQKLKNKTWPWEVRIPENASFYRMGIVVRQAQNQSGKASVAIEDAALRNYSMNTLAEPFTPKEAGAYEMYLRVYRSPQGGMLSAQLDGSAPVNISTKSDVQGYKWVRIYGGTLDKSAHTVKISNVRGFNSVNAGYLLKDGATGYTGALGNKTIKYVLEAEYDFEKNGAGEIAGGLYSRKRAVKLGANSRLSTEIEVFEPGQYQILLGGTNVSVEIDGAPAEGNVTLGRGRHSVEILPQGSGIADYAVLAHDPAPAQGLNGNKAKILSYERTGPSSYKVMVESSSPYMLVFTEDYETLWRASVDGKETGPIPVYAVANGFFINKTGVHEVDIYFGPQPWHELGLVVSGAGYLSALIFLAGGYLGRWKV
ncbi:MAG TPA: hypothetical protein VLD37_06650 [Candidatus Bilamarchaeum sp.]|nr:hypothetical protein [Candidatus Bilamarchaeum sp.]